MRYTDWEGIFIILLAIGIVLFGVSMHFRESLPKERRIPGSVFNSFGKFVPIVQNGGFMNYVWIQMFSMGVFFTYIASSPFLIQEHFRLDAFAYSICFAVNASGMIVGSRITPRFSSVFSALKSGVYGLCLSCLAFVAVLLFDGSFYLMETLLFVMMNFLGMILPTSTSLALTLERDDAGGASAVIGFSVQAAVRRHRLAHDRIRPHDHIHQRHDPVVLSAGTAVSFHREKTFRPVRLTAFPPAEDILRTFRFCRTAKKCTSCTCLQSARNGKRPADPNRLPPATEKKNGTPGPVFL